MTWGKLVAALTIPLNRIPGVGPTSATPCKASDHHWYAGTPRRGIPGAEFTSWEIFSSTVSLETISRARRLTERSVRQNWKSFVVGFDASHACGGDESTPWRKKRMRRRRIILAIGFEMRKTRDERSCIRIKKRLMRLTEYLLYYCCLFELTRIPLKIRIGDLK